MYESIVEVLKSFKASGVLKEEALSYLEFDEYVPDFSVLNQALEEAYND